MRTDGRTDTSKLVLAFRNFAKDSKKAVTRQNATSAFASKCLAPTHKTLTSFVQDKAVTVESSTPCISHVS